MKLLFGSHTDAMVNCGCDYALIDLSPESARELLRKIELVRELRQQEDLVSCVEFDSGCQANFLEACEEIEEIQTDENKLADSVWNATTLKQGEDDYLRTECDRLIIYANENKAIGPTIFWRSVPKHSDIDIETDYIPIELIERLAKGE